MKKRLMAVEVWFFRRLLRISWTEKKSNLEVLSAAGVQCTLMNTIRQRQIRAVIRRHSLEKLVATRKVPVKGRRARRRQRLKYLDSSSIHAGKIAWAQHSSSGLQRTEISGIPWSPTSSVTSRHPKERKRSRNWQRGWCAGLRSVGDLSRPQRGWQPVVLNAQKFRIRCCHDDAVSSIAGSTCRPVLGPVYH